LCFLVFKERDSLKKIKKGEKRMKKLGLLALVLGMVVAFAVPAMSFTIEGAKGEKMYIGGIFYTDMGWLGRSKELTGTNTDQTQFLMTVPTHSRLRGSLEIGNVGGFWEFGMGGAQTGTGTTLNYVTTNNYVETRKLYGWYKFGNCEFQAGKNDGYYFHVAVSQWLGLNWDLHVNGFGWGALYDARDPQVRFTQNLSKNFGYMITLLQPTVWTDPYAPATSPNRLSYNYWPRLAAKLMFNYDNWSLFPAFQGQYAKWDNLSQVPPYSTLGKSPDDNVTSWQAVLPVVFRGGPFTATAQFYYGQNSAPFYGGFASGFHAWGRDVSPGGTGAIKTTTDMGGFINLAYAVGAALPAVYFGYDNAKNSDLYKTSAAFPISGDDYNSRMMIGASCSIKIAEGFFMTPEFTYYDFGKYPAGSANAGKDFGKEWIGGIQFAFVF
jgi:hypothetical protein